MTISLTDPFRKGDTMGFEKCSCVHCGQNIEYPSEGTGETIPCPTCNNPVVLTPAIQAIPDSIPNQPTPLHELSTLTPQVYLPEIETPLADSPPPPQESMMVVTKRLYVQLTELTASNIKRRTPLGDTPLHRAAKNGIIQAIPCHFLTAELFAEKNTAGDTPLHIAVRGGFLHQVPSVFLTGETLTVWDGSGETPLHIAAHGGQFCRIPRKFLTPELLSLPTANQTANTLLHFVAAANRLNQIPKDCITPVMWSLKNGDGLTPRDSFQEARELLELKNETEHWRRGAATDKQKEKLRYFGCTWDEGITKGQASDAIDECVKGFPDEEQYYYNRPATAEQLKRLEAYLSDGETPDDYAAPGKPLTYGQAKDLIRDCELDERAEREQKEFDEAAGAYNIDVDMWAEIYPGLTWKRVQAAAKVLDESRPGWRQERTDLDIMVAKVAELYPQLCERWRTKGVRF